MSVNEKDEGAVVESRAEGQRSKGATQPATPGAGRETFRIGKKDDIRVANGEEGGSTSTPRDTLRDGT